MVTVSVGVVPVMTVISTTTLTPRKKLLNMSALLTVPAPCAVRVRAVWKLLKGFQMKSFAPTTERDWAPPTLPAGTPPPAMFGLMVDILAPHEDRGCSGGHRGPGA